MTEPTEFRPTEAQIADVIRKAGNDPRKLAIAYLRAQHRARGAETAFGVMADLSDIQSGLMRGDLNSALDAARKAKRRMAAHEDITETERKKP